jgi:HAD superfamily hydrolase (TIGR01509 family)
MPAFRVLPSPVVNSTRSFDAIVFDLDGVIVDSEIWWDDARRDFAAEHGRTWTLDDRHAVMGANSRQWSETIRERLGLDLPAEEIERAIVDRVVARYRSEGPPIIDGAVDAARRLAATWPSALASSAHHEVIDAALETTGLQGAFREVVSSDDVARGKPAPDVYLEAARRLGLDPSRCLVIEDSLGGIQAAKSAGMTAVLVPNATIPPAPGARELADYVVDRLLELDPAQLGAPDGSPDGSPNGTAPSAPAANPAELPGAMPSAGDANPVDPAAAAPAPVASDRRDTAGASTPVRRPAADARPRSPRDYLPAANLPAWRRTLRYYISRLAIMAVVRAYVRIRVEGRERLPGGPAVLCFNHLNWTDPFMLMATLPLRPRLFFFGPKEEDMAVGGRNRLMGWTGSAVPYKPEKNDLLEATRKVRAVFQVGGVLGIAGEGRIQPIESDLLPLNEGPAFFALRSGVPIVPIAINGTSWLTFGRRVRIRIGEPIPTSGRATHDAVAELTDRTWHDLHALLADAPALPVPGRAGRWMTERFNDWVEGSREAALVATAQRAEEGASQPGR